MTALRRILHPTDFSPASRGASAHATKTAAKAKAELLIAHVLSPIIPLAGDGYISPRTYDEFVRSARAQGQKELDAVVAKARRAGARASGLLLEGVAWDQIVRAAKSRRADLIVMGTHGRTGLGKLLMGSVAERVVGHAHCPVLTVRGKGR